MEIPSQYNAVKSIKDNDLQWVRNIIIEMRIDFKLSKADYKLLTESLNDK